MTAEAFIIYRRRELAIFFRSYWGKHWARLAMKQFNVTRLQCYRLANPAVGKSKHDPLSAGYLICAKWEEWGRLLGFVSPLDNWIAKGMNEEEKRIVEMAQAKMKTHAREAVAQSQAVEPKQDPAALVAAALGK